MRSGWKGSKASGFSPVPMNLMGCAGDVADGEGRAAAGVAVHLGEDDAGEAEALVEVLGGVDGVLAGHGVGDEEDLLRVEELFELLHLGHELFVDVEAAGGVDDEGVAAEDAASRRASLARRSTSCGVGGLGLRFCLRRAAGFDGLGNDLELLARGGAVDVDRDEHGAVAALFEPRASLPQVVVLPEPCRPAIRMTVGGWEANLKRAVSRPRS